MCCRIFHRIPGLCPKMLAASPSHRVWPPKTSPCCCSVAKLCPTLLQPHGLSPARLVCAWSSLGKNPGVGCRFLLQEIFLTQGSNLRLVHWQADSLPSEQPGKLKDVPRCFKTSRGGRKEGAWLRPLALEDFPPGLPFLVQKAGLGLRLPYPFPRSCFFLAIPEGYLLITFRGSWLLLSDS